MEFQFTNGFVPFSVRLFIYECFEIVRYRMQQFTHLFHLIKLIMRINQSIGGSVEFRWFPFSDLHFGLMP